MCSPLRIGVDAMSLIYKYKSEYKQVFPYLKLMKDKGHTMTFVFDGKAPVEKEEEIKDRRDARQAASNQATILKEQLNDPNLTPKEREILEYSVSRFETQGWHLSREVRLDVQAGLDELGIQWVKAISEADTVLNEMAIAKTVDVVMSTDMDFLLSGVRRLWIPSRDSYEEILVSDILVGEGIDEAGMLDAGILCGVEPLYGKLSISPKVAFGWIRHYGSLEGLLARRSDTTLDVLRDPIELARVRAHFRAS